MDTTHTSTGSQGSTPSSRLSQLLKHLPPEILIHISTFLDPKSIDAASKTCRQWFKAFQHYHSVKHIVKWPPNISDSDMDNSLTSLHHAPQRLTLVILPKDLWSKFLQYQSSRESVTTVETRMTGIQGAKPSHQSHPMLHRLTALDFVHQEGMPTLSLSGHKQVRDRCLALIMISPLSQLAQLSLKDVSLVPVNVILEKCSRLRKLSISFSFMGAVTWDENHCRGSLSESSSSAAKEERCERNRQEAGGGTCNKQFLLRTLVLQNVQTSFHGLIQWLSHLARLDTLQLQTLHFVGANPTYTDADTIRPEFYAHIGAACPVLQSFHISFDSLHRQQPQVLDALQASFPSLQELSLRGSDLTHAWVSVLPKLFAWFHVASRLTSLEITPPGQGASRVGHHVESLNIFLCSEGARTLRHLSVKGIYFPAEYLSQSQTPTVSSSVWRCRKLETLHMRLEHGYREEATAREARQMFGYLSTVCPALRDLWIARKMLHLGFNSGLCLLTRLHKLETLTIVSDWDNFLRLRIKDLEWIGTWYADRMRLEGIEDAARSLPGVVDKWPTVTRLNRLKSLFRTSSSSSPSSQATISSTTPTVPFSVAELPTMARRVSKPIEYLTWSDLNQLGKIQDLLDWNIERLELVQFSKATTSTELPVAYYRCWPHMHTFEFVMDTWGNGEELKIVNQLKLIRPDIRFKAESSRR